MGLVIVFRLYKSLLIWVGIVFLMNVLYVEDSVVILMCFVII